MDAVLMRPFLGFNPEEERNLCELRNGSVPRASCGRISFDFAAGLSLAANDQLNIGKQSRFQHCSDFMHDFVLMSYTYSGQNKHTVNGKEIVQRPGEIILFNQSIPHENPAVGEDDIVIMFGMRPRFLMPALSMIGYEQSPLGQFLSGCVREKEQAGDYLHIKAAHNLQVRNLLENLIANAFGNCQSASRFTMGLLCLHLLNQMNETRLDSEQGSLVFEVMRYIDDHYADGSLCDLANRLYYNESWLSQDIKRLSGSTFTQLQQNRRIAQAKLLLSTTSLPVAAIAEAVGYGNSGFFYRLFQSLAGCSPGDYRESSK